MAFNLKEYILFRTEIKRELFNEEVDTNFKMVSNPWVATRRYEKGNIVYHPVTIEKTTGDIGATGEDTEYLAWWRANKRTTLGVFDMTQWDIIGGVGGFTDVTIAGAKGYGKILANWQYPATQVWDANFDGVLEAVGPTDTIKFAAGPGISIAWNDADEAMLITNTGNLGEINNGDNIGTTSAQSVYDGMTGGYPQNDIKLKGFRSTNVGNPALTVSTVTTGSDKDIVYDFNEAEVTLANISNGSPILNELSDIVYAGLAPGDILYWSGTAWQNQPASAGMGNTIYTQDDTINNSSRIVTLNGSPGGLSFRSSINADTGLYIDNNGKRFVFGENATGPSGEYFRFNTNVNTGSPYHISLVNADNVGGSAMWFSTGGNANGFIAGMTNEFDQGSNYAIAPGSNFNGAASGDAFTVDQNRNIWVYEWGGNPSEITDTDNERLIPFAKAKGTETGITAVNTGLLFVDDGSGGTAKGSQANALLVNRRLSEFEPRQKVGLAVANTKSQLATSTNKGQFTGIDVKGYSFNGLGSTEVTSAFVSRVYDETSPSGENASTVTLSTIAYAGSNLAGPTTTFVPVVTVGSLVQNRQVPTNLNTTLGHVSYLNNGTEVDMGLVAVNETNANVSRNIGIFSDVVNEYDNLTDVSNTSEFPITETKWSGLFVGCVAIKKGGLYLEPQSTNPLCGGYTDTLWVSDVDNHLYFGDVDITNAAGCAEEGLSINTTTGCFEWGEAEGGNGAPLTVNREIDFKDFDMHFKSSTKSYDFWFSGGYEGSATGTLLDPKNISSLFHIDNRGGGNTANLMNKTSILLTGDTVYNTISKPYFQSIEPVVAFHGKFQALSGEGQKPTWYTNDPGDTIGEIGCQVIGRHRFDGYLPVSGITGKEGVSTLYTGTTYQGGSSGGDFSLVNAFGRSSYRDSGEFTNQFTPFRRPVRKFVKWVGDYEGSDGAKQFGDAMDIAVSPEDTLYNQPAEWRSQTEIINDFESWDAYNKRTSAIIESGYDETDQLIQKLQSQLKELVAEAEESGCDCTKPATNNCVELCAAIQSTEADLENAYSDKAQAEELDASRKKFNEEWKEIERRFDLEDYAFSSPTDVGYGSYQIGGNLFVMDPATGTPDVQEINGSDILFSLGWEYDDTNSPYEESTPVVNPDRRNNASVMIGKDGYDFRTNSTTGPGSGDNTCFYKSAMLDVLGNAAGTLATGTLATKYPFVRFRNLPIHPLAPSPNLYSDGSGYIWETNGGIPSEINVEWNGIDVGFPVTTINFSGSGVVAKGSGGTVEVNIPGGGGGGGEANTASNVGSGVGLFKQKSGVDLEFYSLTSTNNIIDIDLVSGSNVIDLDLGSGVNWQKVMDNGSTAVNLTTSVELETSNFIDLNTHEDISGARMVWDNSPSGGTGESYSQVNAKGVKQYAGPTDGVSYPRTKSDLGAGIYEWRIDDSATSISRMLATGSQIQYDAAFIDTNTDEHQSNLVLFAGNNTSQVYITTNRYPSAGVQHDLRLGTDANTAEVYMKYSIAKGAAHEVKISAEETKAVISAPLLEIRSEAATGYTIPTSDGAANQVLKTDGSGTATWQDESGGSGGGGSLVPVVKSANYTAAVNDLVLVNSSTVSNVIITLPEPTANGQVIGVKWVQYTNINDTPTIAGFDSSVTIDGVDRSVATGTPLPLPSLWTYYEFIAYVNGDTYVWFIK